MKTFRFTRQARSVVMVLVLVSSSGSPAQQEREFSVGMTVVRWGSPKDPVAGKEIIAIGCGCDVKNVDPQRTDNKGFVEVKFTATVENPGVHFKVSRDGRGEAWYVYHYGVYSDDQLQKKGFEDEPFIMKGPKNTVKTDGFPEDEMPPFLKNLVTSGAKRGGTSVISRGIANAILVPTPVSSPTSLGDPLTEPQKGLTPLMRENKEEIAKLLAAWEVAVKEANDPPRFDEKCLVSILEGDLSTATEMAVQQRKDEATRKSSVLDAGSLVTTVLYLNEISRSSNAGEKATAVFQENIRNLSPISEVKFTEVDAATARRLDAYTKLTVKVANGNNR